MAPRPSRVEQSRPEQTRAKSNRPTTPADDPRTETQASTVPHTPYGVYPSGVGCDVERGPLLRVPLVSWGAAVQQEPSVGSVANATAARRAGRGGRERGRDDNVTARQVAPTEGRQKVTVLEVERKQGEGRRGRGKDRHPFPSDSGGRPLLEPVRTFAILARENNTGTTVARSKCLLPVSRPPFYLYLSSSVLLYIFPPGGHRARQSSDKSHARCLGVPPPPDKTQDNSPSRVGGGRVARPV